MAVLSFLTYLRGIYKMNLTQSSKVHYAVIQSIYDLFVMAKDDIDLMRLEMCLSTATGKWLDTWGEYFAIYRKKDEGDDLYRTRIIDSIIKPKTTIPSIKDTVVDYLNNKYDEEFTQTDVVIKEPWWWLSKYSHKGTLSHSTRMYSNDYWCHAVIDIQIPERVTRDLIDLVNAIKAAGVKVFWGTVFTWDILSGFNNANDAWAAYSRHLKTKTQRNLNGLVLSQSSKTMSLSGTREVWSWLTAHYYWYAKILDKKTDESIILTKKDLMGVLDYFIDVEGSTEEIVQAALMDKMMFLSHKGEMSVSNSVISESTLTKITDGMLASLEVMDKFMALSYRGRMSTSSGVMFEHTAEHELYTKLLKELEKFKELHEDYYNALQPPILNGDRVMWLINARKNWLWNTPTLTHADLFKYWEPYGEYEEHTINSIVEFEDAYYNGYITFADKYQPPVVSCRSFLLVPTPCKRPWLWDSAPLFREDLPEIWSRQFESVLNRTGVTEPTIADLEDLEEATPEKYSTSGGIQSVIEVKSTKV